MKTDTSIFKTFKDFLGALRGTGLKDFDDRRVSSYILESQERGYSLPMDDDSMLQLVSKYMRRLRRFERTEV